MGELPAVPLKDLLRDPTDDLSTERALRRMVAARLAERRSPQRFLPAFAMFSALAVLLVSALFVALRREEAAIEAGAPGLARDVLLLANGEEPSVLAPATHHFAEGSTVVVAPDASLRVLDNRPAETIFLLEHGGAAFGVASSRSRRWTVECGLASVEVLASRFTIAREAETLEVAVEDGMVLVRGERVPDRVQRLTQGMRLTIAPPREETVLNARVLAALQPRDRKVGQPEPKREPESATSPERVPREDEPSRPRVDATPAASELLDRADRARVRGDFDEAAALLQRIIDEHASDPSAALAAFMLGRVELENLGHPQRAMRAFERALSLGLPLPLVEAARAHLADARAQARARQ